MSTKDALGPFQAGDGGLPPYLAGREYEQEICGAFLSRLCNGRPPPREIVLHGPRGNGKTALLAWLRKEVAAFPGVDAIRLVPAAIRTETKLVERLLPSSWWQRLAPGEVSLYGIELMERNLLPVARTVAEVFRERSRLSDADLDTAIVRGLGEGGPVNRHRVPTSAPAGRRAGPAPRPGARRARSRSSSHAPPPRASPPQAPLPSRGRAASRRRPRR